MKTATPKGRGSRAKAASAACGFGKRTLNAVRLIQPSEPGRLENESLAMNSVVQLSEPARQVRRYRELELIAGCSLVQKLTRSQVEEVGSSSLVADAMAHLVTGNGVTLMGMFQRVADHAHLAVVEQVQCAQVSFYIAPFVGFSRDVGRPLPSTKG